LAQEDSVKFAAPEMLWMAPVLWAVAILVWRHSARRRDALLKKFAGPAGDWTQTGASKNRRRIDRGLFVIALTALIVAIARPVHFAKDDRSELQGAPYLMALDASRSMLAPDIQPNRYLAASVALDRFFAETKADHIGLITFAGVAYMNAPLTFDMTALRTILAYIDPGTLTDPGSSISSALDRASRFFRSNSIPERTLIVISDGEDLEGSAVTLARKLHRDEQITIHTIGVGTPAGGPIPAWRGDTYATNSTGRQIISKLDEPNLRRIAIAGGGNYYPLGQNGEGLRRLREEVLNPLAEKVARNDLRNYHEAYYAPLAVAMAALLARLALGADRVTRRKPLPSILNTK
jgi:Ca-activated chloride channel family protein